MTPTPTAAQARAALKKLARPAKAKLLQGFFKTGPGEYGEGDVFLGITMPQIRSLLPDFKGMPLLEVKRLLQTRHHEERMLALLILVRQAHRAPEAEQERLRRFYLSQTRWVNNWDLVDLSAPQLVGPGLVTGGGALLSKLSRSTNMWERRIAILGTFHLIRMKRFGETLRLAQRYLSNPEDLMHKATGWMLREVGKRDSAVLRAFLAEHGKRMPRTMLRYAIEKFSPTERQHWLESTKSDG